MKLSSNLVERTLAQYDARVFPDNHPVAPQLSKMFGDQPLQPEQSDRDACKVVKLANWADGGNTLAPHEPEETDLVIVLDTEH